MAECGARGQRGIPVSGLDDVRGPGCARAITVDNVGHCPPPPPSRWTIAQSSVEPTLSGGLSAAVCAKALSPADRANALDQDVCPLPKRWFGERMGRLRSGSVAADRWLERLRWVAFCASALKDVLKVADIVVALFRTNQPALITQPGLRQSVDPHDIRSTPAVGSARRMSGRCRP